MPPPKLHLNEHISPRLAEQLRKYGFDVTSTLEVGMVEADDDEQETRTRTHVCKHTRPDSTSTKSKKESDNGF
jgi:hypothetical protein